MKKSEVTSKAETIERSSTSIFSLINLLVSEI
jgi:hypothetical protein